MHGDNPGESRGEALGTLQGVRGFNDPRALRQANGNSVFVQTDAAGNSYAPWRLDTELSNLE